MSEIVNDYLFYRYSAFSVEVTESSFCPVFELKLFGNQDQFSITDFHMNNISLIFYLKISLLLIVTSLHTKIILLRYNNHIIPSGRVVSELGAWLCACASRSPIVLADSTSSLVKIARACDDAAKSLPSAAKLDADLLGWPGLLSRKHQLKNSIIRK